MLKFSSIYVGVCLPVVILFLHRFLKHAWLSNVVSCLELLFLIKTGKEKETLFFLENYWWCLRTLFKLAFK